MKYSNLFFTFLFIIATLNSMQQSHAQVNPNRTGTATDHVVVSFTKSMKSAGVESKIERNPRLKERSYPFIDIALPKGNDPVWQTTKASTKAVTQITNNFNGQSTGSYPPDCNGVIGPNHYFQTVNTTYAIYNKTTGTLIRNGSLSDFFPATLTGGGGNDGDPIVLYDEVEQRWLMSQFKFSNPYYMLIAISRTNDPTGDWDSYSFLMNGGPDYMKFGIWRDGYYMATNTSSGSDVYVFEKAAMLAGAETPKYVGFDNPWRPTTLFDDFYCIMPLDNDFTQAADGEPGLFITINDDAVGGGSDQLWIFECAVDWNTMSNSTFDRVQQLNVAAFDSNFGADWDNIMQPNGLELDANPNILMFRAQYLNFGSYQTIVACHTVDVNATDRAGIRWYELRKTTGNWEVRQQSTYSPDSHSRWMGSISMNQNGEIGLGYSVASSTVHPGIRVVGQTAEAHDAANSILDVPERSVVEGTVSQTTYERWGDYAEMSVDPSNGTTFWFTTEYLTSGTQKGTKIASFNFTEPCTPPSTNASGFSTSSINDNDISFNWTRGNGDAILIVVKAGTPVDMMPEFGVSYNANTNFGDGSEIGSGNFVVYNGTGTSATITGLTPGTYYSIAFYEYFSADNCYSNTGYISEATTTGTAPCNLCESSGNMNFQTSITLVDFNSIHYVSAKPSGYSDYTSISTDVQQGVDYDLTVNLNTDGNFTIYATAWVDWNQDCDFNDAGESFNLGTAKNKTDVPTSLSPLKITIPADAKTGNTLMRVSAKYGSAATACSVGFNGEVEEYTLNVIPALPAPSNLVANISGSNVSLSWTAPAGDVSGYKIYRSGGTAQVFTVSDPNQTTYTDMNLSTGSYEYYVTALYPATKEESAHSNTASVVIGDPNAIAQIENEEFILVYPNPGEGLFNVEFKTNKLLKLKMSVYSASGQLIASYGYKNLTNGVVRTIDLRRREKGVYYLKIEMDDKIITKQIVVK